MGYPHFSNQCSDYHDVVIDVKPSKTDEDRELTYSLPYRATLSNATIAALLDESTRAHLKHVKDGGSIFDPEMSMIRKLGALGEETGEVNRLFTYDGGKLEAGEWVRELMKELLQTANVAITWYQQLAGNEED